MEEKRNFKSSMMTGSKLAIYQVESFLEESYLFRRNVLNGKTEFICINPEKDMEEEEPENSEVKENSEIKEISGGEGVEEKRSDSKEGGEPRGENLAGSYSRGIQLHRTPRQEIGNWRAEVAKTGHRGVHQVGCCSRLRPYPGIHEQVAEMGR